MVVNGSPIPRVTGLSPVGGADSCATSRRRLCRTVASDDVTRRPGSGVEQPAATSQLRGDVARAALDLVGRAQGPVPGAHLLLGLMRQRRVDQMQQLLFCQKQMPNATATATSETISRVRSSSRWPTTLRLLGVARSGASGLARRRLASAWVSS